MSNVLKFGKDYDETTRFHMYLREIIAQNEDGTISLRRSNGRRRTGRPSYYYLRCPNMMSKKFAAENDDVALEIANRIAGELQEVTA